jgi:hypothetical protein
MGIEHLTIEDSPEDLLGILDRDGGVIVENVVGSDVIARIHEDLDPFFSATEDGLNDFWGCKTKRIGALMARSESCRELAINPFVNALCEPFLSPYSDGYQLNATQAVLIGPEESNQPLHRDRGVWGGRLNRSIETQFSTIWAIDDFTNTNGATQFVPGSHRWDGERQPTEDEIQVAVMPAGSVMLYSGSVLHGGGVNTTTDQYRLGVLIHYTLVWLRQEENQYLSCPPEVAKHFSPELRALMGYTLGGPILGFYSTPGQPGKGVELASPETLFIDN